MFWYLSLCICQTLLAKLCWRSSMWPMRSMARQQKAALERKGPGLGGAWLPSGPNGPQALGRQAVPGRSARAELGPGGPARELPP